MAKHARRTLFACASSRTYLITNQRQKRMRLTANRSFRLLGRHIVCRIHAEEPPGPNDNNPLLGEEYSRPCSGSRPHRLSSELIISRSVQHSRLFAFTSEDLNFHHRLGNPESAHPDTNIRRLQWRFRGHCSRVSCLSCYSRG